MFSLLHVCPFVNLVVSHLGFNGGNLVLIAPVPGHCFPSTLSRENMSEEIFGHYFPL